MDGWDEQTPQHPAPYATSAQGYGDYAQPTSMPTYAKVVIIIDLVFCSLRLLLVPLSIFGMTVIEPSDPLYPTAIFEILTLLGIALFGIPGNALLLMGKPIGILLVGLAILATIGSIGVGFWQMPIMLDEFPPGSPERTGGMIGGVVVALIRLGIIVMVGAALMKFKAWSDTQHT